MYRAMLATGEGIVVVAVMVIVMASGAVAQEAQARSVQLTPSRDSGVSGTASLEDVEGGVEVRLNVRGLPEPGIEHINHIHGGATCADDRAGRGAPATIPLKTVTARDDGTGTATTVIKDKTVAGLFDTSKERYVLLHAETKKGEGIPPGITCADLVWPTGESSGSKGAQDGRVGIDIMPDTGGTGATVFFVGAALLTLGVAVRLSLRNKT